MPKSRAKTRANAAKGKTEARLDVKNSFGITDLTPKRAVAKIIRDSKLAAH